MYERFTDRARKVMQLANREAHRRNHVCIGTGHILLGLIFAGGGVAIEVLKNFDVNLQTLWDDVERRFGQWSNAGAVGELPQTPHAKQVIKYAMEEARNLNHNYVGTEHILLGLVRYQDDAVAARVLAGEGLGLEKVRHETLRLLAMGKEADQEADGDMIEVVNARIVIHKLPQKGLVVTKPLEAMVPRNERGEYVAWIDWPNVTLSASGSTVHEAACNLADIAGAKYLLFSRAEEGTLGKLPRCQLDRLREHISVAEEDSQ